MDALSGDVQGFASSRPVNPGAPLAESIPAPKMRGRIAPAAEEETPEEDQSEGQEESSQGEVAPATPEEETRAPASVDDSDNPFVEKAAGVTTNPAVEENPFEDKPKPIKPPADNTAMRGVIDSNLQAHIASLPAPAQKPNELEPRNPVEDFVGGLEAGLQISVSGLGIRGKMPDTILPGQADMAMRIGSQIGQLAGDLPAMFAGGLMGGAAGTAAPVVGNVVGATAGAFAVPAAVRKMLTDHYEKGDITDTREFAARLMATSWEAIKGGTVGAATALTGGIVNPVAGKLAGAGAELVAMTTVGSALEGHLPTMQDFADGAIVIGGIHAMGHVIPGLSSAPSDPKLTLDAKLKNIYAETGEHPADIIEQAKKDVELKQQLLAGNMQEPEQAMPKKLEHGVVEEPAKVEGEAPEVVGTKTELVPKTAEDLDINPKFVDEKPREAAENEILSKLGESDKPVKKGMFDGFYAKNVDYLNPLNAAIEEAKAGGAKIDTSAYDLGRLFAGHMDKVSSFMEFGTRDAKTGAINGESLNDIMRSVPNGDINGLRAYSLAARALELDSRGIKPWENFDKDGARQVVAAGEKVFGDVNQRRIDFSNRVLDYARDKGLLAADQVEAMKEANKNYVPFNRAFEANEVTGTVKSGSALKKIFGSEKEIVDPILQTYKNTEMIMKKALINEVRGTFVDNLKEGKLLDDGSGAVSPADAYLRKVESAGLLGPNQIAVFKNGVREVYEGTPLVIDSLRRLEGDKTAMDVTTKILKGFANATRLGVVSNPAFGFAHYFRSQIMAGIYSKTGMIPFIHSALSLGDFMSKSEDYQNWLYNGGASGSLFKLNENYLQENKVLAANKNAPFMEKAWNVVKKPMEASEAFIKLTDNLSRFTEYKRSIERGVNPIEAAMRSRDVVPDYAKVGLQRSALRTGVAFIGAHINSLDRMYSEMTDDPKGFALKMSAITAVSSMLYVANKDDEAIDSIPDWQKNTYWNINISRFSPNYKAQDATILRLPKPWAPGILFGSGAEVALDSFFKDRPQEFSHFAQTLAKSVLPELIPNMLQPVLDQYSNKQAFTGRPLVSKDKEQELPEMKYSPYTSETAKAIGKLIGYVPLVRDIGPSVDPLASPVVVENYIHAWGGTVGGWALKVSDWAGRGFKDDPKNPPWQDTPVLHQFVSRYPSFSDQRIQDFYENKDKADQAYNSYKALAKSGDFDAAQKLAAAHPDYQVRLDGIAKGISAARRTFQAIQEDPNIPAVEKRQNLDTILFQIGSMAKEGNQMMSAFHKGLGQNVAKGQGE